MSEFKKKTLAVISNVSKNKTLVSSFQKEEEEEGPLKVDYHPPKFEILARALQMSVAKRNENMALSGDRVMYARNQQLPSSKPVVVGGTPITEDIAFGLRNTVFGTTVAPARGEWLRTGLVFREPDKNLSYGLKAARNGTRGLISVIQAEVVKYLLFNKRDTSQSPEQLLKASLIRQIEALLSAICDILWRIGEATKATLCLPQEVVYIPHSHNYFQDSITEKLHIFDFTNKEDLQIFLKRYIYLFMEEPGPGALLILYSAILTRGIPKVLHDLEDDKGHLVTCAEEGSLCIVTLLLTGRATPFLHNGVVYVGDEEHYAVPQFGILGRGEIGFLLYEEGAEERVPGSRLKTPSLPIWVVCCLGHYGILFNTNRELLRNYHAERRFDLMYYTCGGNQCQLTVDTRQDQADSSVNSEESATSSLANLEKLIHTKWQDAHIHWTGSTVFI
uniref:Ubiquitin carboxyl-terminal hydrolase MINDY n=1 Tax=Clastoptera arizonana TaxID=38151 RepID=A0A1B6CE23_9HEMI